MHFSQFKYTIAIAFRNFTVVFHKVSFNIVRLLLKGIQTIALPRKIVPQLGLGFGSRSGIVLGLGTTRQLHLKKIVPRVGLGFGLGLVLGLAAVFLECSCPRTLLETSSPNIFIYMLSNIGMSQRMYVCVLVNIY